MNRPGATGALQAFVDDHVEYFDWSFTSMMTVPRVQLDAWHLSGLRLRFVALRDRVALLKKLADAQQIDELREIEDVVPLLFEHTMYKSFPASLLTQNRFDLVTAWLGKLTTHDLSTVDTAGCDGIDSWLQRMDDQSPLIVGHTSGTTGSVSFLPWSKTEFDKWGKQHALTMFQRLGDPRPIDPIPNVHIIYPYYRSGAAIQLRQNENFLKYLGGGEEERFHAAFPERLSSDITVLAGRIRAARANGELDRLEIPDSVLARVRDFEGKQPTMEAHLRQYLGEVLERLKGERVFMGAPWSIIYPLAVSGLEQGVRGVFSPDSTVTSGGGAKGLAPPPGWQDRVMEFAGVESMKMSYAMSEVAACHMLCSRGYYHILPSVVPFVLDPDSSKPLPRSGTVTGRAAFFDLLADSHWGGFISGDEVTLHWDEQCTCGATTVFVDDNISRYSDMRGGDDKITCAAQPAAHAEALEFLDSL